MYIEKLIISKLYVTVCTKTDLVHTTTQFYFITAAIYVDALNNYPSPVYQIIQMLNVNWSAFLEGTYLLTLQNHKAPMKGVNYVGGEDLRLLPLPVWSTNVARVIVDILAALEVFFAPHSIDH